MTFINYKKKDLKHIEVSDLNITVPHDKNINKTETIAKLIMKSIDASNETKKSFIGSLLPTKSDLAYALGVSLGTIQNVLSILEAKGYIYLKQRIGSIIKNKEEKQITLKKRTSKKDIAEKKIKEYIMENGLCTGMELPVSRQLAREINMTFNTVRNALSKLIVDGVLENNEHKKIIIKTLDFSIEEDNKEESLVNKVKNELKQYIISNYKMGDKLPTHDKLAQEFNVSMKTIHNAIQLLVQEKMLLPRRGSYGTIVINTSDSSSIEPRKEMSIFAPAQETMIYHYHKIQNKIKNLIIEEYDIGEKLPSINELSLMFDVNKNTIRKALNNLAKSGILRFTRGRYGGTYVINLPEHQEQTYRWLAVSPQYKV